jgi:hypothetical protein
MSLRKYFNILGLPESATPEEVRRQYRKLVMQYHPDKNPSNQAKEKFLLITDAYEIIIGKKKAPTGTHQHISRSKEKTADDRVREAKKRYYEQLEKEQLRNELFYRSLFTGWRWKLIKISSVIGLVLALAITIDLFLPRHYEKDQLSYYAKNIYSSVNNEDISLVKTKQGQEFWITGINYQLYGQYPEIYVERSWIFHQAVNLISIQKIDYTYYPVSYTFYSVSPLLILLFILPFLAMKFKRRTILYTIMYYTCVYITPYLILFFIFSNDHWAHLLTLGFL